MEPKEEPREDTKSCKSDENMDDCDFSPSHKSNETRTSPDPRRHDDPPHEPESPRAAPACPPPLPPIRLVRPPPLSVSHHGKWLLRQHMLLDLPGSP